MTTNAQTLADLWSIEQDLAALIADRCEVAENAPGVCFDDTTENGEAIVYPENAATDPDAARALVQEAIDTFREGCTDTQENEARAIVYTCGRPPLKRSVITKQVSAIDAETALYNDSIDRLVDNPRVRKALKS